MSTRLENAITEYWWNHQSLQEELSRLTNFSTAATTTTSTQTANTNEEKHDTISDSNNKEETNITQLIEMTKLQLNEVICNMVHKRFVNEANELGTEKEDDNNSSSTVLFLEKHTPISKNNSNNTSNAIVLTEIVHKLANHLLEVKQHQRDEARQFAQWASTTTNITTKDTDNTKRVNEFSCNDKMECNWDDDTMSCFVEAFALCFDLIIKTVNNANEYNENNKTIDKMPNYSDGSNGEAHKEKWSKSHIMWCDNLLKDIFVVSTSNTEQNINMSRAIIFGLLHLFYMTLQITPAEIAAHFPLVQYAVRKEWQAYINALCTKWNAYGKKESNIDYGNKNKDKVDSNKIMECMNECAELLTYMRLAFMFFVSDNQHNINTKKKVNYVSSTTTHNYNNFYYSVKKRLTPSTTAPNTKTVDDIHNGQISTEHASFCVLLPLTSYKDGVWCVNILRSLLISCQTLFKSSLPSTCTENEMAWENLRTAAHEFVMVFTTQPNLSINMLSCIDLLASIFWSEDKSKAPMPESTNINKVENDTALKEREATDMDELSKCIRTSKYKAYKSCLTYMYEIIYNKSNINSNSKNVSNVKQVSTSTTKSHNLLEVKSRIAAIHISNTFVAHALTQYAETNIQKDDDNTKTSKVTAITNTNANNNNSTQVKNTSKENFDEELVKMLSYTLLHSPVETLHTIFNLFISDNMIGRTCSIDKLVSEKDDFVRRSAAYNENDCIHTNNNTSSSLLQNQTHHDNNKDMSSDAHLSQIIFNPRFYSLFALVENAAQYIYKQLNELGCTDKNDIYGKQNVTKDNNEHVELAEKFYVELEEELQQGQSVVVIDEHTLLSLHKDTNYDNRTILTLYLSAILDVALERYLKCAACVRGNTNGTSTNTNSITNVTTSAKASVATKININDKCHDLTQITAMSELFMFLAMLTRSKLTTSTNSMSLATNNDTHSSSLPTTTTTNKTTSNTAEQYNESKLTFVKSALQLFFTPLPTMLHYLHRFIVSNQCYGLMAFFLPLLRDLGVEYSSVVEYSDMGLAVQYPASAEVSYLFELPRCFFTRSECKVALNMHQDALFFLEQLLSLDNSSIATNNEMENEEESQKLMKREGVIALSSDNNEKGISSYKSNQMDLKKYSIQQLFIDLMVEAGKVAISRLQSVPFASAPSDDHVGQWVEQSSLSSDHGCTVDVVTAFWYGMLRLLRCINYWNSATRASLLNKIKEELFRVLPIAKSLTPITYLLALPEKCNSDESHHDNTKSFTNVSATTTKKINNNNTDNSSGSSNIITNVNVNTVEPTHQDANVATTKAQKSLMSHWVQWFWSVHYDDVDEHPIVCAKALLRSCNLQYIKSIPTKTLLSRRSALEQHNAQVRSNEKHILTCMENAIKEDVEELSASQKIETTQEKSSVKNERSNSSETHASHSTTSTHHSVNLSASQMSDYTHRVLTTLLQRSRMSAVDGALCGVAARLFIVSCANNKFISREELMKFLKRLVYLISVRLPFATPQECLSFAMCLRVITDTIFVPYLRKFVITSSTNTYTSINSALNSSSSSSSSITRSGSVSHALASVSSTLLTTKADKKLDESECIVQALGNNAHTTVEFIHGVIQDLYEAITSCLRLNSERGDWNAYHIALHTGCLLKLTKKYDDQYKRSVEARRQVLAAAKPLSDANSKTTGQASGVERSAGFVKLAHLDRPLLFHLSNPTSSLFELCGVKEVEGKTQMSHEREYASQHYHYNISNNNNNRLQSSHTHSESRHSHSQTEQINVTHHGSTHRTLHTSRDECFTNRQINDENMNKSKNSTHSHASSHMKESTENLHLHKSEHDHRHYHNHNHNNNNNNKTSTIRDHHREEKEKKMSTTTHDERSNESKTSNSMTINSKEVSHSDKANCKRDRSLHRNETSSSHHRSLHSDHHNNNNNKKNDDDESRRRRYKEEEEKKAPTGRPESSRSHHHEFSRHDRDKNEMRNNESKRFDRHEVRNERHASDYKHYSDNKNSNDNNKSRRHYDEAYPQEHRYHGHSSSNRRDADYDRHHDNRSNRHRR